MLLKRLARRAAAILIVCLYGTNVSYVAAGVPNPQPGKSQLGGWVFIDRNNDGIVNFATHATPEWMIGGVTIELYAQSNLSTPLDVKVTDQFGRYFFDELDPAITYALREIQPIQYVDGIPSPPGKVFSAATPEGAPSGVAVTNGFNNIMLLANSRGDYYNFGERGFAAGYISKALLVGYAPIMEFGNDEPAFVIPEPATIWLTMAAVGIGLLPRRRRQRA
jgi:hypothetical protein